jgi:electron transport complex protein RnfC
MKLIKLEKNKNIIPVYEITYFLNPSFVYIPITQENPEFKSLKVYKNEEILDSIYTPVSGKIKEIVNNTVVIENDLQELKNPKQESKKKKVTKENIINVLKKYHAFELLEKFSDKDYDNIVVSAISDEAYVYNLILLLKEKITDVLEILNSLNYLYKTNLNYLAIKSNESFIIDECLEVIGSYPNIKLTLVMDEYLLGREKYLKDKLELKGSTLYIDVLELLTISDYLNGEVSSTRLITISGDALKENKVFRIKRYTKLQDIIDNYITINTSSYEVYINGLMTGKKVSLNEDIYLSDDIKCVNIMQKKRIVKNSCIDCDACINICPLGLNPKKKINIDKCIDCGLCTYICPCNINLREFLQGEEDE